MGNVGSLFYGKHTYIGSCYMVQHNQVLGMLPLLIYPISGLSPTSRVDTHPHHFKSFRTKSRAVTCDVVKSNKLNMKD